MVGCNGALMGTLPWLFGAFLADFPVIRWSWLQLPLAVCAVILHLIMVILQVSSDKVCSMQDFRSKPEHLIWMLFICYPSSASVHSRRACMLQPCLDALLHII